MKFFIFFGILIFPLSVHAYLDPGSGSYIIQIVLATLFGGLAALKIYWSKIKLFFVNLFSKKNKE